MQRQPLFGIGPEYGVNYSSVFKDIEDGFKIKNGTYVINNKILNSYFLEMTSRLLNIEIKITTLKELR